MKEIETLLNDHQGNEREGRRVRDGITCMKVILKIKKGLEPEGETLKTMKDRSKILKGHIFRELLKEGLREKYIR